MPDGTIQRMFGTITSCAQARTATSNGISGGTAGYQSVNAGYSHTYECSGAELVGEETEIDWPDFDAPDNATEAEKREYYKETTRDNDRGRARKDYTLFMNKFDICRSLDNTDETNPSKQPIFVGVKTYKEWESVHGVDEGDDPNGGYTNFANNASIGVDMHVCCTSQFVEICGTVIPTGFANVGDVVEISTGTAYAAIQCVSNNTFQAVTAIGICGGGGGGGGGGSGGGSSYGYSNPATGGTIAGPEGATTPGYSADPSVSQTNAQGLADMAAAAEAETAESETDSETAESDEADNSSDGDGEEGDGK